MIYKGKGENKEYCNKVIEEILNNWDEIMYESESDTYIKKNKET